MKTVMIYFLLFIIYSMIGWIVESTYVLITNHKFINRGFLIGPYLPIYGVGALTIVILLRPYHNDYFALFVLSVVTCSIIEYLTSYIMEKLFKARWWDYSHLPFNVNGRICLTNSLAFGFLGSLIILINSHFMNFLNKIPNILLIIIFTIVLVIFIADLITSCNIINKIKLSAINVRKDYSEEITTKVKNILEEKSILFRRILHAFPNFKMLNRKK